MSLLLALVGGAAAPTPALRIVGRFNDPTLSDLGRGTVRSVVVVPLAVPRRTTANAPTFTVALPEMIGRISFAIPPPEVTAPPGTLVIAFGGNCTTTTFTSAGHADVTLGSA